MPLQVAATARTVTVSGVNLFALAAEQLGDHTQWSRIARLNGLRTPYPPGVLTLTLPPRLPKGAASSGVIGV